MEKISILAAKLERLKKDKQILIGQNLVRDFSVFCKMCYIKTNVSFDYSTNKYLFELKQ
jgi:hypothetical protein